MVVKSHGLFRKRPIQLAEVLALGSGHLLYELELLEALHR